MVMKGIRFGNPSELKLPVDILKSVESPYPNETSKRNSCFHCSRMVSEAESAQVIHLIISRRAVSGSLSRT